VRSQRELAGAGRGRWWGAFRDGRLVASAGLVRDHTLGRYQNVMVDQAHRRRGIASALISVMAADHLTSAPGLPLVIIAERGSVAAGLYRALGFARATTSWRISGPVPAA